MKLVAAVRTAGLAGGLAVLGYGAYGLLTDHYVNGHQFQIAVWAAAAIVLHDGLWVPGLLLIGSLVARLVPDSVRTPVRTGLLVAAAVTAVGLPAALRENDHNGNPTLLPLPYLRNWLLVLLAVAVLTALATAALRLRARLRDHGQHADAQPKGNAAMARNHTYRTEVRWTGDLGTGTSDYRAYDRSHDIDAEGRPSIQGSSDPAFRGDPTRWNPELLLVASLSECHMLWYLHYCAVGGVVVTAYTDAAEGTMSEDEKGGRFTELVLRPRVEVAAPEMVARAEALHADAHRACFIANSVNFPVRHEGVVWVRAKGHDGGETAGTEAGD